MDAQEDILAVGRLCAESDTAKMTETASYLESSRSLGSGHRVLLKFEPDCKVRYAPHGGGGMGLFPGAMVALKGINGGGKLFAVKEILMVRGRLKLRYPSQGSLTNHVTSQMPPIDPHYTAPSELLAYQHGSGPKQLNGSPMSVIVAAGPYTVESDLDYEPLDDFLGLVKEEKPDVLIMASFSHCVGSHSRNLRSLRVPSQ